MATRSSQPLYPYRSASPHEVTPPRLGRWRFLTVLLVMIVLGAVVVTVLSAVLTPPEAVPCTQRCGPTSGVAVPQPSRYHSSDFGFDLPYTDLWKIVQQDRRSVLFQTVAGQFMVSGQNAGKSDQQLVQEAIGNLPDSQFQSITPVSSIRGAHVGYQDGTGVIFSATFLPQGGRALRARVAVVAATKNRVSVTVVGIDPWAPKAPNGIPESPQFDAALSEFQWPT
jgi:hypothetical protein